MTDRLSQVARIGRAAGALALSQYQRVAGEVKADQTVVTAADRAVERFVRDQLEAAFPGDTILGEEMGRRGMPDAERVWVVDPIDGTTNFLYGLPCWCVAIGLLEYGRPSVGVIAWPLLDTVFAGEVGEGAWANDAPCRPWSDREPFRRSDPVALSIGLLQRGVAFGADVRVRSLGSAQLHFANVANGALRAGLWDGDYAWDLVAGAAICRAAGCTLSTFAGQEPDWRLLLDGRPQPWGIVVGGPGAHEHLLAAVAGLKVERDA